MMNVACKSVTKQRQNDSFLFPNVMCACKQKQGNPSFCLLEKSMRSTKQKFFARVAYLRAGNRPPVATRQSTRSSISSSHVNDMQFLTDYYAPFLSQNPGGKQCTVGKIPSKCARFSASEASKTHSFQIHFANNMRLFEIFAYYAMIKLWSNLIFSHRKMRRGFLFFSALEATRCIFPFMKASAGVSVSVKRGVETYTVFKNP